MVMDELPPDDQSADERRMRPFQVVAVAGWLLFAQRESTKAESRWMAGLGAAYLERGDNASARACLSSAVVLDPENAEAQRLLNSLRDEGSQRISLSLDVLSRFICKTWDEAASVPEDTDAVVFGSGLFGGYGASKIDELSRQRFGRSLRVLVLEAGPFLVAEQTHNIPNLNLYDPGICKLTEATSGLETGTRNQAWGIGWCSNAKFVGQAHLHLINEPSSAPHPQTCQNGLVLGPGGRKRQSKVSIEAFATKSLSVRMLTKHKTQNTNENRRKNRWNLFPLGSGSSRELDGLGSHESC